MGPHVDAAIDGPEQLAAEEKRVRDECGIRERRDRVEGVVDRVDHRAVVAEVDVPVPAPDTPGVDDPILDTRRSFLEQLNAYKRHNMRPGATTRATAPTTARSRSASTTAGAVRYYSIVTCERPA